MGGSNTTNKNSHQKTGFIFHEKTLCLIVICTRDSRRDQEFNIADSPDRAHARKWPNPFGHKILREGLTNKITSEI